MMKRRRERRRLDAGAWRGAGALGVMVGLCLALSMPSAARALVVSLSGEVSEANGFVAVALPVGSEVSMLLELNETALDLDPSPTVFEARPAGIADFLLSTGPVESVVADAGAGSWVAEGQSDILGVSVDFILTLLGTGLVPDQIGPEFATLDSATGFFDLGGADNGTVTFSIVTIIPEPSTALLLGIGCGVLALRRRAARLT